MKVKLWMCASLVGVVGVGVGAAAEVQATPSTAKSTILAQAKVAPIDISAHNRTADGKRWRAELETRGLTDGYVVDNQFLPGQSTGWHSHPGPSLIFVVSGSVTNYDSNAPGCAGVTYPAGTSFIDAGGKDMHMLRDDGTVAAETIAVQFIPNGQPRRIDVPVVPDGCRP
ncbi:MAG: hypothetical protein QOF87_1072 [Pseudonocardiales bacterium]|jgi:hypothetical protein|nr:hypothetical protein [Pseudonocardiales bacterium]